MAAQARGIGNTGFAEANVCREDHLDVVAEHLGVDRCGALVLAVDELGRPVGHHVAGECGVLQRRDDLGAFRAPGALQRVGDEQDARVVHEHLISVELALVLDLLLERQRLRVARVEPVIAVHDVLRGFRELLDELVRGRRAAEHRIDAFRPHALLLHGARKQHVFVVVVRRDDEIGILRPDLEHHVVEIAGRRRMRNGLEHLEAALGQLRVEQLGKPRSEQRILVHDHHRLGRLAGLVVDGDEVVERGLGNDAEARPEAEGILEAARDDVVGDADVDHVGQVVAGGGLAGGEAD